MPTQTKSAFRSALVSSWALLFGFGILMLGDGLQATLLAVRADQEGFSTSTTGFIMSSFYLGFLVGSKLTPKIVGSVGHIRVFAALAALASATILIHAVFLSIPVWIMLRLISGFCFAGLYVVAESWLNDKATNETRGKILSLYMIVTYLGVALGQLFLNLADPRDFPLFILTSVLISIAVVPLLLSAGSPPEFEDSINIKLTQLFRISPFGSVGIFICGLVTAAFFALGPVYAKRMGLDLQSISYFIAVAVIGTVLLQWPIGWLSDRFDRRCVITIITFLAAGSALLCSIIGELSTPVLLMSVALFGGLAFPLYSLCIAYINDCLDPSQMVAASGTLVLINGLGAVSGPLLIAFFMDKISNNYFFYFLAGALTLMGVFALFRMLKRKPVSSDHHGTVIPTAFHPSSSVYENTQQYAKYEHELHEEVEKSAKQNNKSKSTD